MTDLTLSPWSTPPPFWLAGAEWKLRGSCRNHPTLPPETWDDTTPIGAPRELAPQRAARVERAKAVCATCPVRQECVDSIDLRYDEGIRGGQDIRAIKRAIRRTRHLDERMTA